MRRRTTAGPLRAEITLEQAFGHELRQRRQAAGLSQEELGFAARLHRTYVSQLERGLKSPTLASIANLAAALDASATELVAATEHRCGRGPRPYPAASTPLPLAAERD